ncbi:hypothetical protein N6L24_13875 [Cognatishimia sp. SS12]|uniref:gluconate 2-dehydrogenase subunit 3 family protein n=1 Tax=Cognatishimia sp. SS12 TaxID=2979465 RepID=UPI00232B2834|nr:gluconate 2-dehydrogenase subunit 3 family protein [Cognatishimia sp. SS12]MDC0739372.1 hypothetical protein [Cognatishimia sp. SS12]
MWTKAQSELLNVILDHLIPPRADGSAPGAGALGVAEFLPTATPFAEDPVGTVTAVLDHVSKTAPDFLSQSAAAQVAVLKATEAAVPAPFACLVRLTYMGYYSRPDTRPYVGVGAHPIHPEGYPVPSESAESLAELTAPVRRRGQIYRNA